MDWSLDPIFGSYFIVVVAAMGLVFVLYFVRESGRISRSQSMTLWLLRLLMCLIILLVLLRPGITFTRQSTPRGTVAVMMDVSASMQLPSGEGKATRWEMEREIWESLWNARAALGKDSSLIPFLYDSTLKPLGDGKDGSLTGVAAKLPDRPEGFSTDIGGPLNQLMSSPLESPLSAVIWMGDGAQTHLPSGGDPQQASRRLAQIDVPLFLVGIGPRSDSENSQDLSVEGVPEELNEYTKNQLNVRGLLRARGVANRDLLVKLLLIQPGKAPRELSVDRLRPTKSDQALPFMLPLVVEFEPGAYELAVRAEPIPGEAVEENNEVTVFLNVRSGGARILYIEGEPRLEHAFIKQAMSESKDMQMNFQLIQKEPLQKWPVDLSKRLSNGVYDCFVLGDLDYKAIDEAGAKAIAAQVKKGAGLVTLGGFSAYGAGGWEESALRDILPVDMKGQRRQGTKIDSPIELQNHLPGPIKVVPVGGSEVLQIDTAEKNDATWAQLNALPAANRWAGVKKTPGTIVLAESQLKAPLIVSGLADQGRVISIAFDTTYLWVRQGKANEHKAFWRKVIYWCMRREVVEEGMRLSMPQRRLPLYQPSEMILQWNGGSDVVEMPKNIQLHLWKIATKNAAGGEADKDLGAMPLLLREDSSFGQSMRAQFPAAKEGGRYEWRARVNGSKGQVLEAKLPFLVIDKSAETMQPMPDWQLLAQMAKLNSSAGGTLVAPEQTDEIVRQILDRRKQSTQTAIENRRLGDGVLDTWTAFLLLAAVMICQWSLRKKWNLP